MGSAWCWRAFVSSFFGHVDQRLEKLEPVQLSEEELAAIARGGAPGVDAEMLDGAGGETTKRLQGNYETPAKSALHLLPHTLFLPR